MGGGRLAGRTGWTLSARAADGAVRGASRASSRALHADVDEMPAEVVTATLGMAAPSLETAVEQPDQAADAALRGALGVGERGVLGGIWSDLLLRRGWSLTAARKAPIVAGMLMSMSMILCNYVDARSLVVTIMALSFFGKGVGALGWAVVSDTVPREIAGLSGGLFNMFGNLSSITTRREFGRGTPTWRQQAVEDSVDQQDSVDQPCAGRRMTGPSICPLRLG